LMLRPLCCLVGVLLITFCQLIGWLMAMHFFSDLHQLVCAVPPVGVHPLHQSVGEDFNVTGRKPALGWLNDGSINTNDVITGLDHVTPPLALDVFLELYAEWTVVPG